MKKLLLFIAVFVSVLSAKGQTIYAGGTAGIGYGNETFQLHLLPSIGYEFNEKIALGVGVGFECAYEESSAIFNPYIRFTPYHKDNLFLDVKCQSMIFVGEYTASVNGFTPSFRYRLSDKWEIATDLGTLGVQIIDGDASPCILVKNVNVNASVLYRF